MSFYVSRQKKDDVFVHSKLPSTFCSFLSCSVENASVNTICTLSFISVPSTTARRTNGGLRTQRREKRMQRATIINDKNNAMHDVSPGGKNTNDGYIYKHKKEWCSCRRSTDEALVRGLFLLISTWIWAQRSDR